MSAEDVPTKRYVGVVVMIDGLTMLPGAVHDVPQAAVNASFAVRVGCR